MAIHPPSDIVLDVLKAADPTRVVAAEKRLNSLGAAGDPPMDFAAALDAVAADKAVQTQGGDARARLAMVGPAASREAKQKIDFEAMVLSGFINEMIPKDGAGLFGAGYAGDMWRSVMADQIARQVAKSGATGIAKSLFATHAFGKDKTAGLADRGAQDLAELARSASATTLGDAARRSIRSGGA